jgi:hypothetical protein
VATGVAAALLAAPCAGEVDGSGEDDVDAVDASALVPVLLTEADGLDLSGYGSVPMTSENPDDWYASPPTEICDQQAELVAEDDMYAYLGDGGDYIYLDEWVSGERVSAAADRYANGVAALEACSDAGMLEPVETTHPEIDDVRRYEQITINDNDTYERNPEDNDELVTVLYARNGGVIVLLSLYLTRRSAYTDEQVERLVDTALAKLAAIGRVEVADASSTDDGQAVSTDPAEVTVNPQKSDL